MIVPSRFYGSTSDIPYNKPLLTWLPDKLITSSLLKNLHKRSHNNNMLSESKDSEYELTTNLVTELNIRFARPDEYDIGVNKADLDRYDKFNLHLMLFMEPQLWNQVRVKQYDYLSNKLIKHYDNGDIGYDVIRCSLDLPNVILDLILEYYGHYIQDMLYNLI